MKRLAFLLMSAGMLFGQLKLTFPEVTLKSLNYYPRTGTIDWTFIREPGGPVDKTGKPRIEAAYISLRSSTMTVGNETRRFLTSESESILRVLFDSKLEVETDLDMDPSPVLISIEWSPEKLKANLESTKNKDGQLIRMTWVYPATTIRLDDEDTNHDARPLLELSAFLLAYCGESVQWWAVGFGEPVTPLKAKL